MRVGQRCCWVGELGEGAGISALLEEPELAVTAQRRTKSTTGRAARGKRCPGGPRLDGFQRAGVEQSWGGLKWTQSRKAAFAASTAACRAVRDVL